MFGIDDLIAAMLSLMAMALIGAMAYDASLQQCSDPNGSGRCNF